MINNKIRMFRMVNGGLELFGATMLCFWMFVLLGAPPTFVTGIVSVVPGWLIMKGVTECFISVMAAEFEASEQRVKANQSGSSDEECRFKKNGACTYGEGRDKCAHDEDRRDGDG